MSCNYYCNCWQLFHFWASNSADGFVLQLVCPTTANLTGCAIFVKNDLRNYKGRRELVQYGSCDWAHTGEFSCFPGWLFAILVIGCILAEAFPRLVIPWLIDYYYGGHFWDKWNTLTFLGNRLGCCTPKCFKNHGPLMLSHPCKMNSFQLAHRSLCKNE